MMRHEGHGGQWIKDVVADAIALAKLHNCKVPPRMNGSNLKVNKRLSVKHILRQHEEMSEASSRRYRKSDRYKRMMADMERQRNVMRSEVEWCVANLPDKTNLLQWLNRYCPHCDNINVPTFADTVIQHFESMAFIADDCCELATYSRDESDRYLVGQVISMLKFNGHIHQALGYHIEREIMNRSASEELEVQPA